MYSLAVNQVVYKHINSSGGEQSPSSLPTLLPSPPLSPFSPPLHRLKNSSSLPPSSYEFPNGYNQSFTVEKFKLCEGLFDSSTPNLKVQQPHVTGSDKCPDMVIGVVPSFKAPMQPMPHVTLCSISHVGTTCGCHGFISPPPPV